MIFHGLKTNIVIHLVVILVLAMFLIDFIVLTSTKQLLITAASSKGQAILAFTPQIASRLITSVRQPKDSVDHSVFRGLDGQDDFACLTILDKDARPLLPGYGRCSAPVELRQAVAETVHTGVAMQRHFGASWGVFWKQKRWLILTLPIVEKDSVIAGAGLLLSLEPIYQKLRRMQGFIMLYIAINTMLLTLVGLYGLSQVTLKPLQRLVKRADEYEQKTELPFLFKKDTSEFSRLSNSLNRMLKRIEEDKVKLQATVDNLEKANRDLKAAQRDVIRAEKLATIGRLSSGLAHEIGNPIGIVLGYLELLKQDNLKRAEIKEYLERSEAEVNRINRIIGQLLQYSRTSSTDFTPLSVHTLLKDVRDTFSMQPLMEDIQLDLDLRAEDDTVFADSEQLRQVFLNLMINAADAIAAAENPSPGKVTIETDLRTRARDAADTEKKALNIRFIDNGSGIEKDQLGNIFDPFYTTKEPGEGTGLGLSVSYRIVRDMGGRIEAESQKDLGTTMTITIPVCANETC